MKHNAIRTLALSIVSAAAASAGGLYLEVGNPTANAEAKALNATLVARVTSCQEPGKSKVTASYVRLDGRDIRRTPLEVVHLKTPGVFAVIGAVPVGSVIDLAVTNPQYENYEPRVLLRSIPKGVDWASIQRYSSTPPTDSDVRTVLAQAPVK